MCQNDRIKQADVCAIKGGSITKPAGGADFPALTVAGHLIER